MSSQDASRRPDLVPLPEDVPVTMPALPEVLALETPEQLKALGDPLRTKITHIIQYQPATAKQIAGRLGVSPGAIGHHLHVLEKAGLVQIVALRLVRGTVAKYYARTARAYGFATAQTEELTADTPPLSMLSAARDEITETIATGETDIVCAGWFPHAKINRERLQIYLEKLDALAREFLGEPPDPEGEVLGLVISVFTSPPALQEGNVMSPAAADAPDA